MGWEGKNSNTITNIDIYNLILLLLGITYCIIEKINFQNNDNISNVFERSETFKILKFVKNGCNKIW